LFENLYDQVKAKVEEQRQPKAEKVKVRKNANHKGRKPLPADLLEPLVKRMHEKILQSPKINTDDT
jgi:hypothetical protein